MRLRATRTLLRLPRRTSRGTRISQFELDVAASSSHVSQQLIGQAREFGQIAALLLLSFQFRETCDRRRRDGRGTFPREDDE